MKQGYGTGLVSEPEATTTSSSTIVATAAATTITRATAAATAATIDNSGMKQGYETGV